MSAPYFEAEFLRKKETKLTQTSQDFQVREDKG